MTTLNAKEAADFLKIEITTLCSRAKAGEIPGVKEGRAWVFIEADLIQHLRAKYRKRIDDEGNPWGYIKEKIAPTFGLSSSSAARDLERALAPRTGKKLSRSKRNASASCGSVPASA